MDSRYFTRNKFNRDKFNINKILKKYELSFIYKLRVDTVNRISVWNSVNKYRMILTKQMYI